MVPDYCTCGAQLPPDSRFCHKCGKPQFDYPNLEEPEPPPAAITPPPLPQASAAPEISFRNGTAVRIGFVVALLAMVLVSTVASVIPSSAWVMLGFFCAGVAAATWYARRTGQRLSMRSGARIGWITGIFCFAMALLIFTLFVLTITNPAALSALRSDANMNSNPNFQQMLKMMTDPKTAPFVIVGSLISMFILLTSLPMLGGAVGAKIADRKA